MPSLSDDPPEYVIAEAIAAGGMDPAGVSTMNCASFSVTPMIVPSRRPFAARLRGHSAFMRTERITAPHFS